MNTLPRQVIAISLSIFILYVMYFGAYRPIRKSQLYITARQTQITSIKRFDEVYGGVLSYASPVGQDEIVSGYLGILSEIIAQEKNKGQPNEALVRQMVERAEKWGKSIIDRGAGFSFSQIIFNMANVYREAMLAAREDEYYEKGVALYEFGLEQSPDRQIFLYNLFDMYRFRGDNRNARKVGERIAEVYKDERVAQILQTLQ